MLRASAAANYQRQPDGRQTAPVISGVVDTFRIKKDGDVTIIAAFPFTISVAGRRQACTGTKHLRRKAAGRIA